MELQLHPAVLVGEDVSGVAGADHHRRLRPGHGGFAGGAGGSERFIPSLYGETAQEPAFLLSAGFVGGLLHVDPGGQHRVGGVLVSAGMLFERELGACRQPGRVALAGVAAVAGRRFVQSDGGQVVARGLVDVAAGVVVDLVLGFGVAALAGHLLGQQVGAGFLEIVVAQAELA